MVHIDARSAVTFQSGGDECAGWFYPGANGACIVMATGAAVTKEPGADRFARHFQAAGYGVVSFDYRRFGASGGRPRQVLRLGDQVADLRAAVRFAATLPGVDPDRLVAWGFSLGGGHVFRAAPDLPLAAAIVQTPFADGMASTRNALRHETLGVILGFPFVALADLAGAALRRSPRLVPLAGARGETAMLTTPDARDGARALDPEGSYPTWVQAVAARSVLPLGAYRPGRRAGAITCPLLVVVADDDQSVLAEPAVRAARSAPDAELVRVPGGHYAPFLDAHEAVVGAELDFLARRLAPRRAA